MGQRVDLDPVGAVLDLEEVEIGAGAALIAFAPGDPAVEAVQGRLQGQGLAQGAAGVRVALVQVIFRVIDPEAVLRACRMRRSLRPSRSLTSCW